jgi:hypothetical protein
VNLKGKETSGTFIFGEALFYQRFFFFVFQNNRSSVCVFLKDESLVVIVFSSLMSLEMLEENH